MQVLVSISFLFPMADTWCLWATANHLASESTVFLMDVHKGYWSGQVLGIVALDSFLITHIQTDMFVLCKQQIVNTPITPDQMEFEGRRHIWSILQLLRDAHGIMKGNAGCTAHQCKLNGRMTDEWRPLNKCVTHLFLDFANWTLWLEVYKIAIQPNQLFTISNWYNSTRLSFWYH